MYHETLVQVRFNETDLLGHTNNTSYLIYLDHARIQFFTELVGEGVSWPFILANTSCDFRNQTYYNDKLRIETTISEIGNKSFKVKQSIYLENTNKLIADGTSAVIYFNFKDQQTERIPDDLREKMQSYTSDLEG